MCGAAFLSKSSSPAPDVTPPSVTGLALARLLLIPVGQTLIAVTATKAWAVTLSPTGAIP